MKIIFSSFALLYLPLSETKSKLAQRLNSASHLTHRVVRHLFKLTLTLFLKLSQLAAPADQNAKGKLNPSPLFSAMSKASRFSGTQNLCFYNATQWPWGYFLLRMRENSSHHMSKRKWGYFRLASRQVIFTAAWRGNSRASICLNYNTLKNFC